MSGQVPKKSEKVPKPSACSSKDGSARISKDFTPAEAEKLAPFLLTSCHTTRSSVSFASSIVGAETVWVNGLGWASLDAAESTGGIGAVGA